MARILFLQVQLFPYPGLYYICGALKAAGHEYRVAAGNHPEAVEREIRAFRPQVIGFPAMTGIHREILKAAERIKEFHPEGKILLGGIHPTLFPQVLENPSVDFICRGEGEFPTVELLDALEGKRELSSVMNVWYKEGGVVRENPMRPLVDPLDTLPAPDFSIYRHIPAIAHDTYPAVFMVRGCPYSCTYCHNSNQRSVYRGLGRYVRRFSVGRVLEEAEGALASYPEARALFLGADTLGMDMPWLTELLTRFRMRFSIPYACLVRPEFITEELARLLQETGCHMVAFGIESGSERVRGELLERRYTNEQLEKAARLLKDHGVGFRTYNIIGFPGERREEMLATLELNLKIKPDFPWCSIYTPYPQTRLADYCVENRYLAPTFSFDDVPLSFFNDTLLKGVERRVILNLHSLFQLTVLFPRLYPLVKRTLDWPHTAVHRLVFKAVYARVCIRSENRTFLSFLRLALANMRLFR